MKKIERFRAKIKITKNSKVNIERIENFGAKLEMTEIFGVNIKTILKYSFRDDVAS
ncbi:hypothetical protein LguiA_006315 [Lonicera macranthoides]